MDEDDYEVNKKKAAQDAQKMLEKQKKVEERRHRIKELESNIFEMIESTEGDKLNIKPAYIEPVIPELSIEELGESISRSLVPDNPYCDTKRVIYDYKEGTYKKIVTNSREVLLYEMSGSLIPLNSPEAEEQMVRLEVEEEWKSIIAQRNEDTKRMIAEKASEIREARKEKLEEAGEEEGEEEETEEVSTAAPAAAPAGPRETLMERLQSMRPPSIRVTQEEPRKEKLLKQKKFMNRFTYTNRSVLTYETLTRDKTTETFPIPKSSIGAQVNQWIIYDSYDKDYAVLQEEREKERLAKMIMKKVKEDKTLKKPQPGEDPIYKRMADAILILERMLNQNLYDNISQDCAFYEDPADKYRNDEGVLLPLWEFRYGEAKSLAVTEVKWNPAYKDLFGVTYGLMDFDETSNVGFLCIFTLKNPSFPELVKRLDAGANCLDFHNERSYYVCVGLSDGGVVAFNIQKPHCDTQYRSPTSGDNKSMISSVVWSADNRERYLAFFSIGSDGRLVKWSLLQNELISNEIVTLHVDRHLLSPRCKGLEPHAVATALAFHPKDPELFMVGSDLGTIYKCRTSYASTYLYQMKAHDLPVKRISFNLYADDIFATAGGDWRIKIWEDGRSEPLFLYNLDNQVGDVEWAPYSSTVLAAITASGTVYVYDLQFDKYEPSCAQYVICSDENIATRLRFNPFGLKMPLILLGDSRGTVTAVKISPNLRVKPKPPKKTELTVIVDDFTYETRKLEKILHFVKESIVLKLPQGEEVRELVE